MVPIVVAILGIISVAIPPLAKWLEKKTGGYSEWKSEITYWAGLPRSVKGQFFGRDDELKEISDSLKHLNAVVLSGGPGIGKSKLAAEFANKSKRKGFWTPGGETPEQTLLSLAPHLGIERGDRSDEEILVQTRRRLQALPAKTLWVIDNLSNLDLLNTLLNETGKISILVTSQDSRTIVPEGVEYIPIGVLDSEPATRLLCRRGRYDHRQPIFLEIVDEVGRLPRAVEALAVQLDLSTETPERLLEELQGNANPLELDRFQNQTAGLQIPRTDSLFNALRGPIDALPSEIREALAPFGYTADSPIPMPLAETLTGLSGGELINFFDECSGKSVLSAVGEQVTIHSLTTAVIAATNPVDSIQNAVERACVRLGAIVNRRDVIPAVELHHYRVIRSWASVELDQTNAAALDLSNHLGNAFNDIGNYEEAEQIHQQILYVREQYLGPDHPNSLTSRNNLAAIYLNSGRYEEAASLHQEILNVRERVLGTDHQHTLISRNNLAAAYRGAGHYDEAFSLDQRTHDDMQRLLGPDHPDTIASQNNLASDYDSLGRYDEAAEIHHKTLDTLQRILEPEHPDILTTQNNLGTTLLKAGHLEMTVRLLEETLVAMSRVLGSEHFHTLGCRNNLASTFDSLGRYSEAAELHAGTSVVMERVLGSTHPTTRISYNNLAGSYYLAGRYDEATRILEETLEIDVLNLGANHPTTIIVRNNLAKVYRARELGADADALWEQG